MEEVPIQDFQSVIAIELGAAGALLWEIGFFGGGNQSAAAALLIGLAVSLLPSCVERCPGSSAQMASPEPAARRASRAGRCTTNGGAVGGHDVHDGAEVVRGEVWSEPPLRICRGT